MQGIQTHLRNTFLAGAFAVVPLAVTVFLVYTVYGWLRDLSQNIFGRSMPLVVAVAGLAIVYLAGLVVTISVGKFFLRGIDAILSRIPILKTLYVAWKQVSFTPGGGEGMFAKVVLVPDETGIMRTLGFTSGEPLPSDPRMICVFVPNAPNPIQGKLYVVEREKVCFLGISSEEAFKALLSTGNYFPSLAGAESKQG